MSLSDPNNWALVVAGCGTVGLAATRPIAGSPAAGGLTGMTFIDHAQVQAHNGITCPEYAGRTGQPKSQVLAELARQRLRDRVPVHVLCEYVEEVNWPRLIERSDRGAEPPRLVVLMGLDNWQSRLCLVEDLRRLAAKRPREIVIIQVALERDQAQVSVFGNRWDDPCPACGLATLPETQPCVLFSPGGQLVRGDLQREARAAAALVVEVVESLTSGASWGRWLNTKTNLVAVQRGSRQFSRFFRPKRRVPGCLGPHSAAGPLLLDQLQRCKKPQVSGGRGPANRARNRLARCLSPEISEWESRRRRRAGPLAGEDQGPDGPRSPFFY